MVRAEILFDMQQAANKVEKISYMNEQRNEMYILRGFTHIVLSEIKRSVKTAVGV